MSVPRLKVLKREFKVVMLVDNVGIIVDCDGQPVGGSLVFGGCPEGIAEMGSSLVALDGDKMELYGKKSGKCVQKILLAGEGAGPHVIADDGDGSGKVVVVATSSKVICYLKVPSEEQIKDLLRKKDFKEAITLAEELHDDGEISKETLSLVHAQVGFLLMFDLHFEEAVNHFLLSETMQPSEIFPFIMPDPNRWSLLVPRNRYWGLHPPPAPLESVIDNGLLAIQKAIFLKKAGLETAVDDEFLFNPPKRDDLLDSAIKNSIRYLKASRQKDLTSSVREGVDTLLMYLYRARNFVDEMESLASSENWCIVEELETLLNDSGHLRTLAFLCRYAILYRKLGQETLVLQILAVKLEDSDAAEHFCAEIGRPDAYMQLLDIYLNPTDGKQPMFKAAVRLLHNHGEALDPLQVLERLSPNMPLQLASDTILRMLRARRHHHYQGQVVHNLSRAVVIDANLARLEERSRNVQINDESLCDSCHARLGTKLFAMYPDDTIVCYK
nr:transforming growth factor-beta receptor-associated protein 1 [Tanacetum cinerariifolium]